MIDPIQIIRENKELLLQRDSRANKGSYGKLLVIAGSEGMSGAAYLTSLAAFRTGIGMVKICGPECNRVILQTRLPEAMYSVISDADGEIKKEKLAEDIRWSDYVVIGPGLSRTSYALKLMQSVFQEEIRALLQDKKLLVADADALNIIAENQLNPELLCNRTVITPHIGEMSRLSGISISKIKENPQKIAEEYQKKHAVTVVLKDDHTIVAGPHFTADSHSGCGAMAKAGSGDVLCGFIAGITAVMKGDVENAVPAAVWLHGKAGSLAAEKYGCHSILAGDIAECAGTAIRTCENV